MCELLLPHAEQLLSIFLPKSGDVCDTPLPLGVLLLATGKHAVVEKNGSTVRSLDLLVTALGYQGEHKEGEAKHRHALELNERVLGQGHLETLTSRYFLVLRAQRREDVQPFKVPLRSNPTNLPYSRSIKCPPSSAPRLLFP
jgi:hypothetical protein